MYGRFWSVASQTGAKPASRSALVLANLAQPSGVLRRSTSAERDGQVVRTSNYQAEQWVVLTVG